MAPRHASRQGLGSTPSLFEQAQPDWISISSLRNAIKGNPFEDWLNLHGERHGLVPDSKLPDYVPEADYGKWVMRMGREFEKAVFAMLQARVQIVPVEEASHNTEAAYERTMQLLKEGVEAVWQGLVRHDGQRYFGVPDLIIRGQALQRLFPGFLRDDDPNAYFVLDVKCKSLKPKKTGELRAGFEWENVQVYAYEQALARMLGRTSRVGYIMGRKMEQSNSCLKALAWVDPNEPKHATDLAAAMSWRRLLAEKGSEWSLEDVIASEYGPTENSGKSGDWTVAVKDIWKKRFPPPTEGPILTPTVIQADRGIWYPKPKLEFFVDFETFSNLNGKPEQMPIWAGPAIIFMIGCGHEEDGEWQFQSWIAEEETEQAELAILEAWLAHMEATRKRLGVQVGRPLVHHWSNKEVDDLKKAGERHRREFLAQVNLYDLLKHVFKAGNVKVRGVRGHSLKPVTRALHEAKEIETTWMEGAVSDGMAALAAGWHCYAEAKRSGIPAAEVCALNGSPLMKQILDYNEVDCKAMWEILRYIRTNH